MRVLSESERKSLTRAEYRAWRIVWSEKLDDHNWSMCIRDWYYWQAEDNRVELIKRCKVTNPNDYKFWRDNYKYCVLKLASHRRVMPLPG